MKNRISLSLLAALPLSSIIMASDHHEMSSHSVKLESRALSTVDGNFINADSLEIMRSFQRMLMNILLGEKKDGKRAGSYNCNNKKMCVFELAQYEAQLEEQKNTYTPEVYATKTHELSNALRIAKKDFLDRAQEFQKAVGGSKDNLVLLVEESCQKRNRQDSILMTWATTKAANEAQLFEQRITSARSFKTFLLDLFHFLGDLVHSCPKAHAQLQHRMKKFDKIKDILPEVFQSLNHSNKELLKKEFLKHIKLMHLDALSLDEITVPRLQKILKEVRS